MYMSYPIFSNFQMLIVGDIPISNEKIRLACSSTPRLSPAIRPTRPSHIRTNILGLSVSIPPCSLLLQDLCPFGISFTLRAATHASLFIWPQTTPFFELRCPICFPHTSPLDPDQPRPGQPTPLPPPLTSVPNRIPQLSSLAFLATLDTSTIFILRSS